MPAARTMQLTVHVTPDVAARLDRYRDRLRMSRSTAALVLLERALDAVDGTGED